MMKNILAAILLAAGHIVGLAQAPFKEFEEFFVQPKSYITQFTKKAPVIDGRINDVEWEQANWSVGSSRVDLQACKLEYSIVSPK